MQQTTTETRCPSRGVPLLTKKCFKCGEEKPLEEFYAHPAMKDGHLNKCKECTKQDVSKNYRENRDFYVNYEKKRFQSPRRKQKVLKYQQIRRTRYPEKHIAHSQVSNAVRDGRLIKEPCEVCGSTEVEAHHDDYSKPLKVRWLCRKHHLEIHGKQAYPH